METYESILKELVFKLKNKESLSEFRINDYVNSIEWALERNDKLENLEMS